MNDPQATPTAKYPLVSVVTPSYNAMPFVVGTIKSVQMQDYPAIEHIVIDGGSSDGTREMLQQHPHLTWVSEPDRGQSHALNKGFRRAGGEIIGWLNADDTYQPNAVSTAVRLLLERRDIDMVYGDLQIIDEGDGPVGITRSQPFDLHALLFTNFIKQPTVFMRRRVIEKLRGVDEQLHYSMDWELWLRVGLAGYKAQYLQGQVLANFRLCPGTKSFEHVPKFRAEWLEVLERLFASASGSQIPEAVKRGCIQRNRGQYHLDSMIEAIERRERSAMLRCLIRAIANDWRLAANRGTWFYAGRGLLGLDIDRLRKFGKGSSQGPWP